MEANGLIFSQLHKSNWDLRAALEKINIPTFIVQGRQDPIDLETARDIQAVIKGSKVQVIEKCGHFPWIEHEEEFYKLILEFMDTK